MSDSISREAVLEHYRVPDPQGTFVYCSSILEFVESLPATEPERKTGRWIPYCKDYAKCSACGLVMTKEDVEGISLYGRKTTNYCPNCGALMQTDK